MKARPRVADQPSTHSRGLQPTIGEDAVDLLGRWVGRAGCVAWPSPKEVRSVGRNRVVILGLGSPGLVLEQLMGRVGCEVIGVGRPGEVGHYSRYGKKLVASSSNDLLDLLDRGELDSVQMALLASEYFVHCVLALPEHQRSRLPLVMPPAETLEVLTDKASTYAMIERKWTDVQVPEFATAAEHTRIARHLDSGDPLIVKWNKLPTTRTTSTVRKTWQVQRRAELEALLDRTDSSVLPLLVVQRMIQGASMSCGGYFVDGVCKASIVVKQVRQWPIGVSSYVEEHLSDELSRRLRRFFVELGADLRVSGFMEVEFKVTDTNAIYVLDVNPRAWGWIKILALKYTNLADIILDDADPVVKPAPVSWRNVARDLARLARDRQLGLRLLWNGARRPGFQQVIDVWERDDPWPFFRSITDGILRKHSVARTA